MPFFYALLPAAAAQCGGILDCESRPTKPEKPRIIWQPK